MPLFSRHRLMTPPASAARLRGLELSPIKAVELRASRIPGVVSLAQGIPSFDTPEPIKRAAQRMIAEGACAKYSVTRDTVGVTSVYALTVAVRMARAGTPW